MKSNFLNESTYKGYINKEKQTLKINKIIMINLLFGEFLN